MKTKAVITIATVVLLASSGICAEAQGSQKPTVYVSQNDPLSSAFTAGVDKKQVPVTLVSDLSEARYEVNFSQETDHGSKDGKISSAILAAFYGGAPVDTVSMTVVDIQTKEIVFTYTCAKGSDGAQSAAECLVKHWKEHLK